MLCNFLGAFQLKHNDLVVWVRDTEIIVKALSGGQVSAIQPEAQVPFAHYGCSVTLRLQHLGDSGLVERETPFRGRIQHTRIDAGTSLIAARQQGCPGPKKQYEKGNSAY